ncbi:protein kinase family protein [Flavobacterium rhizosphaerae]|uniref:Kdo domain containing protein n=1 Tax=Flavobacterium rhizosphaerae TaxID=3163298 RepID=A0ABW8YYV8_9FLAO
MNITIHPDFISQSAPINHIITHFSTEGTLFIDGRRNKIKTFPLGDITVNVKSFKVPNFFNKIAYRFLRSSKAQRSYEYANRLMEMGIGTPQPIAFCENSSLVSFKDSYYMSLHMTPDLTYRQLIEIPDYPEHEIILRQFTKFTFRLHEKGVEFKDHTPGNTLINKVGPGRYEFFLVDLNRMTFHNRPMTLEERIKNMSKLTPERHLTEVMSDEYAKLYGRPFEEVFSLMVKHAQYFATRFHRKRAIKRALGLRKK